MGEHYRPNPESEKDRAKHELDRGVGDFKKRIEKKEVVWPPEHDPIYDQIRRRKEGLPPEERPPQVEIQPSAPDEESKEGRDE